jgi:hypothetical protein
MADDKKLENDLTLNTQKRKKEKKRNAHSKKEALP